MKHVKFSLLIAFVVLATSFTQSYGQSTESIPLLKMIGFGMHIEQFKINDLANTITVAPANKLLLTFTPVRNFRLEPEIGINFSKNTTSKLEAKSVHFGLGGFGMFQKGKANFYGGLRFEIAVISNERLIYSYYSPEKFTEKTNRITIGPSFGAEYFFGEHFSFGGEIGLKFMKINTNIEELQESEEKAENITTDSGLLIRFYF